MKPNICGPAAVHHRQKGISVPICFLHAGGKNEIALCEFLRKDRVQKTSSTLFLKALMF